MLKNVDDIRDRLSFSGKGKQNSNGSKTGKCDADSGNSKSTEVPPDGKDRKPGSDGDGQDRDAPRTVDDILSETTPGRETKGRTKLRIRRGGFRQANADFDSLGPTNVKHIDTVYGPGRTGTLPDGRTVTVRAGSSEGPPTLEIRNPNGRGVEIRYYD